MYDFVLNVTICNIGHAIIDLISKERPKREEPKLLQSEIKRACP
jgi:hypothetical protein